MAFLNSEDDEYSDDVLQQKNSVMAIGSGQLTGKGLNNNEVASANKRKLWFREPDTLYFLWQQEKSWDLLAAQQLFYF